MKLHPRLSKTIHKIFISLGIGKGVVVFTLVSVVVSVFITYVITDAFGNRPGIEGLSLAIIIPAIIASVATYINLSLYFELEQSRQEIQLLAITDELTKVFNRRYFFELAEREIERSRRNGRPLAVVLFDVDDFKHVNDTFGHLAGDKLLREMCRACQAVVRPYDAFARFGGEEFIFLLPDTDAGRATAFAERIRQVIANKSTSFNDSNMKTTISIGVTVFKSNTDTVDDLIKRADNALYAAKRSGKNRLEVAL